MLAVKLFGEEVARYVVLAVGCLVVSAGGTLYTFGGYSVQLGIAIDHTDVDFFGSCGDFGLYLGFLFGLWYDKQGPTPPLVTGALLTFIGYFGVWLQAAGHIGPMIWSFYILYFMIGQGSYCLFICGFSTNVRNFPAKYSGRVTSLLFFVFAIPSVICTLVYNHLLDQNVTAYLMLFTIYCSVSGVLGVIFVGQIPLKEEHRPTSDLNETEEYNKENPGQQDEVILTLHPENIIQVSVWRSFTYLDMWLIFGAFFGLTGAGLMWKNTLGSIATAFGMEDKIGGLLITWGSLSAFSRLFFGGLAEKFAKQVPRPSWGALTALIMFIPHFWFLFTDGDFILWLITIGTGIGYGTTFCIANSLVLIYYSTQDAGLKTGLVALAPAIGGTLATYLAGVIAKQNAPDHNTSKCDKSCYEYAFLMSSCFLLLSITFYTLLAVRHFKRTQEKSSALLINGDEITSYSP